jgi:hypothetical protein
MSMSSTAVCATAFVPAEIAITKNATPTQPSIDNRNISLSPHFGLKLTPKSTIASDSPTRLNKTFSLSKPSETDSKSSIDKRHKNLPGDRISVFTDILGFSNGPCSSPCANLAS